MRYASFTRTAAAAAMAMAAAGAANADVFMKVGGAPGDAAQRGFEQQILLSGASLSISTMPTYGPDGEVLPERTRSSSPIYLNKSPDRASPKLMQAAVENAHLGTVEITFTTPSRAGQPQTPQYKWIIEGVRINSFSVSPGVNPGDMPAEMIEISYTSMRYQHFNIDPKTGRAASSEEVTWSAPEEGWPQYDGGCG